MCNEYNLYNSDTSTSYKLLTVFFTIEINRLPIFFKSRCKTTMVFGSTEVKNCSVVLSFVIPVVLVQ